jgi:hypothetical protein
MRAKFSSAMKRSSSGVAVLLAGWFASACGVGFDRPSEVKTLRVLAVQKDVPYPAAGSTVTLSLLWHDGARATDAPAEEPPRPVQIAWLPRCFNPPGGLYYGCFEQVGTPSPDNMPGEGATLTFQIPQNIVESASPPAPGQPVFGQTFAFFAVCAGQFDVDLEPEEGALPLICRDDAGVELGPEGFVAGYTTLYTFAEGFSNANPVVEGFEISGEAVSDACTDSAEGACIPSPDTAVPEIDCGAEPHRCIRACEDDGDASCPEIAIRPVLSEAKNAERDDVSITYFNRDVGEQMWINYYADRGGVKSDVRLLNDATVGWNDDYGTKFFAPKEPGQVTIWAVAHDNRGGVGWARARVLITQ